MTPEQLYRWAAEMDGWRVVSRGVAISSRMVADYAASVVDFMPILITAERIARAAT